MKYFTVVSNPECMRHMFSLYMNRSINRINLVRTVCSLKRSCVQYNHMRVKHVTRLDPNLSMGSIFSGFKGLQSINIKSIQNYRMEFRTFSTSGFLSDSQKTELESIFPLRYVFVKTNVTFWEEYPDGILFDVGYVDTSIGNTTSSKRNPVIVALPSSAGSHMELQETLLTFAKLGYRVIIPNLPVTNFCRGRNKFDERIFQFSVQEKTGFIRDFLKELHIEKVDMLITNGCSGYTGVSLCLTYSQLFKSLVMINPTGLKPTKLMSPLWLYKGYTKFIEETNLAQVLCMMLVATFKRFTLKSDWENLLVSTFSRTVAALSFKDEETRAEHFKSREIPKFAIFGGNSDSLDVKSTLEYLSLINLPQSSIKEMDVETGFIKEGTACNGNYGVHVQGVASDKLHNTQTVVLRKELLKMLKIVRPDFN